MPHTYGMTIFCDDVREEVGGKKTFVGCYLDVMKFLEPYPVLIPTFVMHATILEPFEDANVPMNVKVIYEKLDGQEIVMFDADLPVDRAEAVVKHDQESLLASILSLKASPMIFDADGKIKIRGFRGGEAFRFGSLRLQGTTAPPDTNG